MVNENKKYLSHQGGIKKEDIWGDCCRRKETWIGKEKIEVSLH